MWVIDCRGDCRRHTDMAEEEFPTKHVWQPVRGTLSEGLPHPIERQRAKVARHNPDWTPKKVPFLLRQILPKEQFNKATQQYHPPGVLERLPDEILQCIFDQLGLKWLGRLACLSHFWKEYTDAPYNKKYKVKVGEARQQLYDQWLKIDRTMRSQYGGQRVMMMFGGHFMYTSNFTGIPRALPFRKKLWKYPIKDVRIPAHDQIPPMPKENVDHMFGVKVN